MLKANVYLLSVGVWLTTLLLNVFAPIWPTPGEAVTLRDFSGDYYDAGAFWSWRLSLKPRQTFELEEFTDMAFSFVYTGTFVIKGNLLHLMPTTDDFCCAQDVMPVIWGQRRYIVVTSQVAYFCEDIRQGWEPRTEINGPYYLRQGDWEKPAYGAPILLNGQRVCP